MSYRENQRDRGRWLIIAAALLLSLLVLFLPDSFNQISVMVGVLLGIILIYMGYRVDVWRFYLEGAISAIVGIGLAQAGVEEILATGLLFVIAGLALLFSGAITLVLYLGRHPKQQDATMSEGA